MDLAAHYQQLWEDATPRFAAGAFAYDALINSPADTRRGITLLARPDDAVKANIQQFLQEMVLLEPDQYYYPPSDFHLTLLSLISCSPGFTLDQVQPQAYVDLVAQALRPMKAFQADFRGITASPSCIMVQGFPVGDGLRQLREEVRKVVQAAGVRQSMDQRYLLQTAHCTVIRFREPLRDPAAFLKKLRAYRQTPFGTAAIGHVELVSNDWYQRQAPTQALATFGLG